MAPKAQPKGGRQAKRAARLAAKEEAAAKRRAARGENPSGSGAAVEAALAPTRPSAGGASAASVNVDELVEPYQVRVGDKGHQYKLVTLLVSKAKENCDEAVAGAKVLIAAAGRLTKPQIANLVRLQDELVKQVDAAGVLINGRGNRYLNGRKYGYYRGLFFAKPGDAGKANTIEVTTLGGMELLRERCAHISIVLEYVTDVFNLKLKSDDKDIGAEFELLRTYSGALAELMRYLPGYRPGISFGGKILAVVQALPLIAAPALSDSFEAIARSFKDLEDKRVGSNVRLSMLSDMLTLKKYEVDIWLDTNPEMFHGSKVLTPEISPELLRSYNILHMYKCISEVFEKYYERAVGEADVAEKNAFASLIMDHIEKLYTYNAMLGKYYIACKEKLPLKKRKVLLDTVVARNIFLGELINIAVNDHNIDFVSKKIVAQYELQGTVLTELETQAILFSSFYHSGALFYIFAMQELVQEERELKHVERWRGELTARRSKKKPGRKVAFAGASAAATAAASQPDDSSSDDEKPEVQLEEVAEVDPVRALLNEAGGLLISGKAGDAEVKFRQVTEMPNIDLSIKFEAVLGLGDSYSFGASYSNVKGLSSSLSRAKQFLCLIQSFNLDSLTDGRLGQLRENAQIKKLSDDLREDIKQFAKLQPLLEKNRLAYEQYKEAAGIYDRLEDSVRRELDSLKAIFDEAFERLKGCIVSAAQDMRVVKNCLELRKQYLRKLGLYGAVSNTVEIAGAGSVGENGGAAGSRASASTTNVSSAAGRVKPGKSDITLFMEQIEQAHGLLEGLVIELCLDIDGRDTTVLIAEQFAQVFAKTKVPAAATCADSSAGAVASPVAAESVVAEAGSIAEPVAPTRPRRNSTGADVRTGGDLSKGKGFGRGVPAPDPKREQPKKSWAEVAAGAGAGRS